MKLCFACNQQFGDDEVLCPKDGTRLVLLGVNPLIGFVIEDRYRLEEVIGNGAMGVVYRATQELIGRKVAVKILHGHLVSDDLALKRFHQEARAASRLNHPHIVSVFDYGLIAGDQPYIVMDLLKGIPLSKVIKDKGYLPVKEALPIFRQVCDALEEAHKKKVIHRDIKPDNIVLTESGGSKAFVKVVDFGISKILEVNEESFLNLTKAGTICGSPGYMAPERFGNNTIDERADIYSLGVSLFETLTGQLPFTGPNLASMMTMHLTKPAPSINTICPQAGFPARLESLIGRSLNKDPNDRPQTMHQFSEELKAVQVSSASATEALETISRIITKPEEVVSQTELSSMVSDLLEVKKGKIDKYEEWKEGLSREQLEELKWKANLEPKPTWQAPFSVKLVTFLQTTLPYVLTIALLSVIAWSVYHEPRIPLPHGKALFSWSDQSKASKQASPEALMNRGNLKEAMALFEAKMKNGNLNATEFEDLNRLYLRLAKAEARSHHYQAAYALCQKVSPKSNQAQRARTFSHRLQQMLPK